MKMALAKCIFTKNFFLRICLQAVQYHYAWYKKETQKWSKPTRDLQLFQTDKHITAYVCNIK